MARTWMAVMLTCALLVTCTHGSDGETGSSTAGTAPASAATPAPSVVVLSDADCPIPGDIDNGEFRAAICPTVIGAVNALRARDIERLVALTVEESVNCAAIADDVPLSASFPQCAAVPAPTLRGYVWCNEPEGPRCRVIGAEEYRSSLRRLLTAADPGASDEDGTGALAIAGFDACGSTQFLRSTMIARSAELNDGTDPVRWIFDLLLKRRPLLAEEPTSDVWLIRRVDAAPIESWRPISATPLVAGHCDLFVEWDASPAEAD